MDYGNILVDAIQELPYYVSELTDIEFQYESTDTGLVVSCKDKLSKLHISYIEASRFIKSTHSFTPAYTRGELLDVIKEAIASEINDWYLEVNDISLGQEV